MRFTLVRVLAFFGVLALAACGGSGITPMQPGMASQAFAPASAVDASFPFRGDLVPDVTDPCKTLSTEGLWYFKGSCLGEDVKKSGTVYKLKVYRGITQTLSYPATSGTVAPKTELVTGEATGKGDITGSLSGSKFPLFGSVKCTGGSSSGTTACPGKALMYDLLVNVSASTNANFVGSPSMTFKGATALKGKHTCVLDQLIQSGGSWAYQVTPVTGPVKKGSVTIPEHPGTFTIDHHGISVLAVSCT
ncbi:MAG TPA: hypothetical protein VMF61_10285 [Candidatus Acidoferrales bacterium]|nr:hypothetical protein [Candidatus Acidoferrales bacterium]